MNIYREISELQKELLEINQKSSSVGFVPTMGALHQGHLALIEKAKQENDFVICSIFVNRIQFNNIEDYEKYPQTENKDIELLKEKNCDIIFIPTEKEIFPNIDNFFFNFENLDKVMEGKFRQGHFSGVVKVVKCFFEIINPDRAYFGEKDFQQLTIIKEFAKQNFPTIEIIACSTVREFDGLAMSSRNVRLTEEERKVAPFIYKTLKRVKEKKINETVNDIKQWVIKEIDSQQFMSLEYFEISSSLTLQPIEKWEDSKNIVACIAVFVGNVRLIDNIIIEN